MQKGLEILETNLETIYHKVVFYVSGEIEAQK